MSEILKTITEAEDDLTGRVLTFCIDNKIYGIELEHVIEIISMQTVTKVPQLPDYIKGIINLRGKIVAVVDVRLKYNMPERAYDERTCIIFVSVNDFQVGLIVDAVAEVVTISDTNSSIPPEVNRANSNHYVKNIARVDNTIILILDCAKLINDDNIIV